MALHNDVNPTDNYQIFSQLLNYAKNKHFPTKNVKYNKKKHYKLKWITGAILKSVNTKDKKYKTLAKTDSQSVIYQTLKKDFQQFQKTLKSTIGMAKKMYFHRTFNLYKGDCNCPCLAIILIYVIHTCRFVNFICHRNTTIIVVISSVRS